MEPQVGDQFALLVRSVIDYAIFMLDVNGNIVTWNEGAQRIKGYSAAEIIGRNFSVFYPADVATSGGWTLRGRGLAHPQGRHANLGQRRHHRLAR